MDKESSFHNLPPALAEIYRLTQDHQLETANIQTLQQAWHENLTHFTSSLPQVSADQAGEIVHLGELSPGCQTCKDGTWDCIFITLRCNLNCDFCYSPHPGDDTYGSVFGRTPEQILTAHEMTGIQGISFSGGEPFLEKERLFEWARFFTTHFPEKYYWLYTNGLLIELDDLIHLSEIGIDEIRFNAAATGYSNPTVMESIRRAVRYIPRVTIEIPAIPEHRKQVLDNLKTWSELGVSSLNLHELIYEPGTNSASMTGNHQHFINTDGHVTAYNPDSQALTFEVMEWVVRDALSLSVNHCSMLSKLRQLRNRRENIYKIQGKSHEELINADRYETCCGYRGDKWFLFHPSKLLETQQRYPDHEFIRLVRIAPLSLQEEPKWVSFDKIQG